MRNKQLRLSEACHQHLEALSALVGKPKNKVVEILAAGGLPAYLLGVSGPTPRIPSVEAPRV